MSHWNHTRMCCLIKARHTLPLTLRALAVCSRPCHRPYTHTYNTVRHLGVAHTHWTALHNSSRDRLTINISSYRCRDPNLKDKTVSRPFIFNTRIPIPGKTVFTLRRAPQRLYSALPKCLPRATLCVDSGPLSHPTHGCSRSLALGCSGRPNSSVSGTQRLRILCQNTRRCHGRSGTLCFLAFVFPGSGEYSMNLDTIY